jgi:hypothetical protein
MKTPSKAVAALALAMLALVCAPAATYAASSSFGYINIGTSNASTFEGVYVCNFISPSDLGNITAIEAYLSTGGTTASAVIYSDSNGKPDALLAQSENQTIAGTSGEWVSFNLSYMGEPSCTYWMGIVLESAGTYYYAPNANGKTIYASTTTDNLNPFSVDSSMSDSNLSVFAVYDPSVGASSEPTGNGDWLQWVLVTVTVVGVAVAAFLSVAVLRGRKKQKK